MTSLGCSVENCIHNRNRLCEMSSIEVKGRSADSKESTCCSTFRDGEGSFSNKSGSAEPETEIYCSAAKCKYNDDNLCYANNVDIYGKGALNSENTACATFYNE